ncbi:hypothetical protein [uncultured phage cr106_1]|uniref:Uncharacterized protein n=1 Tax=uncultured phage cr106_1 TaxID=2772062 RepID=A0A7M1RX87_9CAUD|nr:hypothetical protein KNV29_gp025 [uncultured phage cr106_1]QOR58279.1 hypothetical protein [uncultured phage cr106_1]
MDKDTSALKMRQPLNEEELKNALHQVSEQSRQLYLQNQQLAKSLEEANLSNFFKRLEWLWRIITSTPEVPLDRDFIKKCAAEFQSLMAEPTEQVDSPEENKE